MNKTLIPVILFAVSCVSCVTDNPREPGNLPSGVVESTSEDWAFLAFDETYQVTNNTWNKAAASGIREQTVFLTESAEGARGFGWKWNWSSASSVVAYPEVIFGVKPWDITDDNQPSWRITAATGRLSVDFSSIVDATGIWNMAFSIWGYRNPKAPRDSISHEIMIWNSATNIEPAGSLYASRTIDGRDFRVYVKKGHGDDSGGTAQTWTYVAFRPDKPFFGGTLDVGQFLDFLVEEQIMDDSVYVSSIEWGNEVVKGAGLALIDSYGVTVTR